MKMTRSNLRNLINKTLQEGFFSDFGERTSYGITKAEMLKNASEDALTIYNSCAGAGTREDPIREIIKRRAKDLPRLYGEFNNLIMNWVKGNATGMVSQEKGLQIRDYNQDLIAWLDQDGMKEEANQVAQALKDAGKQRKPVPAKTKGFFG